jgi:hypothetical protein
VAWQDVPDDAEVNARDTKGERSSMRARAPEYLTRRSSCGESINVTTCHQSGSALLPSASPAHPHPPLLLFLRAPNPSAALRPSNLLHSSFEGGADCSAGKARRCLHRIYDLIYNCSWHNFLQVRKEIAALLALFPRDLVTECEEVLCSALGDFTPVRGVTLCGPHARPCALIVAPSMR